MVCAGRGAQRTVVEVRHVGVGRIESSLVRRHRLEVLLVRDVERRAADAPLAVERDLVVRKTDVERALVRVQPRVLDREHPRGGI